MALQAYGEFDVADKADNMTDEQVPQIDKMAMDYIPTSRLLDKTLVQMPLNILKVKKEN